MQNIDLHCHSTVSDGLLPPAEVVQLAATHGVQVLALTDHDDLSGLAEARACAQRLGVRFVNGVEISVTWEEQTVHIVGLGVDPENSQLQAGLAAVRLGREARARRMAEGLAAAGIPGTYAGALAHAGNKNIIARPHFARHLVERGVAKDVAAVFKRFLVKGKPGYTRHQWAALPDAVAWIIASGGQAVLAHPGRYPLGRSGLSRLMADFRAAGGVGIEVATSNHTRDQTEYFADCAERFGLLASRGSDYHGPGESFLLPGRLPDLPARCVPVWSAWAA